LVAAGAQLLQELVVAKALNDYAAVADARALALCEGGYVERPLQATMLHHCIDVECCHKA
jgi:hypothetical protein